MRAKAPGKVVLSGAYSVLEGAPALVAAVDRYVTADSRVVGDFLTDEVKAAGISAPYWFDASTLRHESRKLGLGSSAAILVATLAAQSLERDRELPLATLRDSVYPRALEAHRKAQGGGSGIDVAASCYGGYLQFNRESSGATRLAPMSAFGSLHVEVWSSSFATSTAQMLSVLRGYAESRRADYQRDIAAQVDAATTTAHAWSRRDERNVILGLVAQRHALQRLGHNAKIPIVTRGLQTLADQAEQLGAAVLPAGAGGGDIALFVGPFPSTIMAEEIRQAGHVQLPLSLGAAGVHADVDPIEGGPS